MRVLLVGLGKMGYEGFDEKHIWTHWQALQGRNLKIDACELDVIKGVRFVEKHGGEVFSELNSALNAHKYSTVVIATPPETHLEIIGECANAGVTHILCEKPLAHTVDDARAIVEVCRVWGLKLVVGHQRRYHAGHKRLKQFLDESKVSVERAVVIFPLLNDDVMNNGSHAADLALFYEAKEITLMGIHSPMFQVVLEMSDTSTYIYEDYGRSNIDQMLAMYEDLFNNEPAQSSGETALAAMRKVDELCLSEKSIQATG